MRIVDIISQMTTKIIHFLILLFSQPKRKKYTKKNTKGPAEKDMAAPRESAAPASFSFQQFLVINTSSDSGSSAVARLSTVSLSLSSLSLKTSYVILTKVKSQNNSPNR